jgi:hypothetical protein
VDERHYYIPLVQRLRKKGLACATKITVFGNLPKALPRRRFATIVKRHDGAKHVKGYSSCDHSVTLVFGQLGGLSSLREMETVWNAQAVHRYHLGSGPNTSPSSQILRLGHFR